jgi:hypothetical protein
MKLTGAVALGILALFMFVGFLNSDAALGAPATLAALALTIGLPALGAGLLLRSHFTERTRLKGRKALLRQQTLEAEILRLAREREGRLTTVEVAMHLAMTPEAAKEALDALVVRGLADLEITDAGLLVYSFYDIRHLGGKSSAKGVLDA